MNFNSPRYTIAKKIEEFCQNNGLNSPYLDLTQNTEIKGKPYSVIFARPAITDGQALVYSEKYILIKWQTRKLDLPQKGSEVFKSIEGAINFLEQL